MEGKVVAINRRRQLLAAAASDTGRVREHNEDVVLCDAERGLYAVIDGVGGELAGETSARTCAEVLTKRLTRRDPANLAGQLRDAITHANNRIYEMARRDPTLEGMACVLTVALVDGHRLLVGHVGDTRLYRLRHGDIEKLTRDHSPIGLLEDRGEIDEIDAMHHPRRNEIYRDVGSRRRRPDEGDFVDLVEARFEPSEAFLLCSDGLTDQVTQREIRQLVETFAGDPAKATRELVQRANEAGGKDNISVVLVLGEGYGKETVSADSLRSAGHEPGMERANPRSRRAAATRGRAGAHRAPAHQVLRGQGESSSAEPPISREITMPGFAPRSGSSAQPRSSARLVPAIPRASSRAARKVAHRPALRAAISAAGALALLAVLVLVASAWTPVESWPGWARPVHRAATGARLWPREVLRVGPEADFESIAEALAASRKGQRIEIEPGEYAEALQLRSGVELISRVPRGAILLLASEGTAEQATGIHAVGVHGAAIRGLHIIGLPGAGVTVGLRLVDSEVEIDNVEIENMTGDAVILAGTDRSTVRYSHLHDNRGAGLRAQGAASPRILDSLFERNGLDQSSAALELSAGATALVVGNRFSGDGQHVRIAAPQLGQPDAAHVEQIRQQNRFSGEISAAVVTQSAGAGEP